MVNNPSNNGDANPGQPDDVQSYLITKYREALKAGDKSYAKSCLLSTRLFSVNDPNITHEIYLMAKSDGDACEAAKCFTSLVRDLLNEDGSIDESISEEHGQVVNQLKEEIRSLMNELKTQSLKLKSTSLAQVASGPGQQNRIAPSITQSPLLSPRRRMASEDRATSKDSIFRLDIHLRSSSKSIFYQHLFENLPDEIRRTLCTYSIETCTQPFERCRLMMLTVVLLNETVPSIAPNLFKTLVELSNPKSRQGDEAHLNSVSHYAASMLILDAIPLVFSLDEANGLDVDLDQLINLTLRYHSENCLENSTGDYEFDELHEGLKKTIAARILGKELNMMTPDDPVEETLVLSLNLLIDKFFLDLPSEESLKKKLKKFRSIVADRGDKVKTAALSSAIETIKSEFLPKKDAEVFENPDPVKASGEEVCDSKPSSQASTATATPPKSRGRPKKVQSTVIISSSDIARENLIIRRREYKFILFSLTQLLFQLSSQYLKQVKSKILLDFQNQLTTLIEPELANRSSSQRTSRGKNHELSSTPAKRLKTELGAVSNLTHLSCENQSPKSLMLSRIPSDSPLNSEQSKKLDAEIMQFIDIVQQCDQYLKEIASLVPECMSLLYTEPPIWLRRVRVDIEIKSNLSGDLKLDDLFSLTENKTQLIKRESNNSETSTLTVATGSTNAVTPYQIRAMTQMVSCYIQKRDKYATFKSIDALISKLRLSGLLNHDGGYSMGNIIEEYMILLDTDRNNPRCLGFLFFDTLSITRYVIDVLVDILKIYMTRSTIVFDAIVGHSIVLSQFDWPKEAPLYEKCIAWIRANKPKSATPQCLSASTKFTYPQFFQYVTNPHIIEDFMSLLNEGYTLDITGAEGGAGGASASFVTSTSSRSSQAGGGGGSGASSTSQTTSERTPTRAVKSMTTRGVNRNFKDHLKCMLIDQMEHSSVLVPLDLITGFIQVTLMPLLMEDETKKR